MDSIAPPPVSPPPLDYGLAPPRGRRRRRRTLLTALVVGLAYCAWQWGGDVWNKGPTLYRQWQCMTFTGPADFVVYEEDPAAVERLLRDRSRYGRYRLKRGSMADPTPVDSVAAAAHIPSSWLRYRALAPPRFARGGETSGTCLFLHERISPKGNRRLVFIRYYPETYSFTPEFLQNYNCDIRVITPQTWTTPATEAASGYSVDVSSGFPRQPPRTRIYAGQPDPDDPSKFTIRYEMWGKSDVLDGQLGDDDRIVLKPRNMPSQ